MQLDFAEQSQCERCYGAIRTKVISSIYRYATGHGVRYDPGYAEDAYSEALEEIMREGGFTPPPVGIPAYAPVCKAARRHYRRIIYRESSSLDIILEEESAGETHYRAISNLFPDSDMLAIETQIDMDRKLTPELLRIVRLVLSGYTQPEISRMIRISQRTLRRRLQRVRASLSTH